MAYSIYSSNLENNELLFLKSNDNDTKIRIENNKGFLEILYSSSNIIKNNINDLVFLTTEIDTDNYINNYIKNDIIKELNYKNTKLINFDTLHTAISDDLSEYIYSDYIFSVKEDISNNLFIKYNALYLFSTETPINKLENYLNINKIFIYDENLSIIDNSLLNGIYIEISLDKKYNLNKIELISKYEYTIANKFSIFSKLNNNLYKILNISENYDYNFSENIRSKYISDKYVIIVESIILDKIYYNEAIISKQLNDTFRIKQIADEDNESKYALAYNFYGIKLYGCKEVVINNYDIDMVNCNIYNISSISTDQIILNNKIYTDIISKNNLAILVDEYINANTKNLPDELYEHSIYINNLEEVFNEAYLIRELEVKSFDINSNLYIPFVQYNKDSSLRFYYYCNINIKNILQLSELDLFDGILQHSNNIIYKSNNINDLNINNLYIKNNIEIVNDLKINNNILRWSEDSNKFKHSGNTDIQNSIFNQVRYEPLINVTEIYDLNSNNPSFLKIHDLYSLSYKIKNDNFIIKHPNFRTYYINYISSQTAIFGESNINMLVERYFNVYYNILNLIISNNIYISSRYGNNKNNIDINILPYANYIETNNYSDLSERDVLKYNFNYKNLNSNYYYLDFFEYEASSEVLLKGISFYDISYNDFVLNMEDIDLFRNEKNIECNYDYTSIYKFNDKNYIYDFSIIGKKIGNDEWNLIYDNKNLSNFDDMNMFREFYFNNNIKYKNFRFVFKTTIDNDENLPFILKDLRYYIENSDNSKNNILYNESFIDKAINFNNIKTFSLNNSIDWDNSWKDIYTENKIRTRFIINQDLAHTIQHDNSFAVCHINEEINNDSTSIHMLRLCLNNKDSLKYNDIDNKDIYTVYHTLNLHNCNLYYTLSQFNNLDKNRINLINNDYLTLTTCRKSILTNNQQKGVVGINLSSINLCNMIENIDNNINNCEGLIINPKIRICKYDDFNILKTYVDIGITDNANSNNSYLINLPDNNNELDIDTTYYLSSKNIDIEHKSINLQWSVVGDDVFKNPKIYIGNVLNSNIHTIYPNNTYSNLENDGYISENLIHIRKTFIGNPNLINLSYESNLQKINDNALIVGGQIYATTDIATDSDITYKYDFEIIKDPRLKINQLTGYTFNRNDTNENRRFCGLIAQDVEKILPEAIIKKHDGKLRVMYNNLASLFVESFKDLYKELDDLKKEVNKIKLS